MHEMFGMLTVSIACTITVYWVHVINSISMNASKSNEVMVYNTLVMQESFKAYNVNFLCHFQ